MWVNARTERDALVVEQSIIRAYETLAIAISNCALIVKPSVSFLFLIVSFGKTSKWLKKNQKLGLSRPHSIQIIHADLIDVDILDVGRNLWTRMSCDNKRLSLTERYKIPVMTNRRKRRTLLTNHMFENRIGKFYVQSALKSTHWGMEIWKKGTIWNIGLIQLLTFDPKCNRHIRQA